MDESSFSYSKTEKYDTPDDHNALHFLKDYTD